MFSMQGMPVCVLCALILEVGRAISLNGRQPLRRASAKRSTFIAHEGRCETSKPCCGVLGILRFFAVCRHAGVNASFRRAVRGVGGSLRSTWTLQYEARQCCVLSA